MRFFTSKLFNSFSFLFLNEHNGPDWWCYTYQYVKQGGDFFLSFIFGRNHRDLSRPDHETYFQAHIIGVHSEIKLPLFREE